MRKVVLKANEQEFNQIKLKFDQNKIKYFEWKEMPENIFTCIATAPIDKSVIFGLVKHLKLFQ